MCSREQCNLPQGSTHTTPNIKTLVSCRGAGTPTCRQYTPINRLYITDIHAQQWHMDYKEQTNVILQDPTRCCCMRVMTEQCKASRLPFCGIFTASVAG